MAMRVCPQCGSQYVASVRRCIDCDVLLVEEVDPATDEAKATSASTPVNDGEEIAYELEGWSNQLKLSLEGMLDRAGIRRVWEAAVLVVPAEFEEEVDGLIATVEGVDLDDLAGADDEVRIAFDVSVLTAGELEGLDARLYAGGIAHAWTEDLELLVRDDVAEEVEGVIAEILEGEGTAGDDDGAGLELHRRLSTLYVAIDKLVKNPLEPKPVARFVDAAEGIDAHGVPYGLSGDEWSSFLATIDDLRAVVAGGDGDDGDPQTEDDGDAQTDGGDGDDGAQVDGGEVIGREDRARGLAVDLRERLRDLV